MWRGIAVFLMAATAFAQTAQNITSDEMTRPFPPFRIVGNLYYVGTYDLACYLIVTPAGDILINTGLAGSAAQIRKNVETLGFHFGDIKLLLATHAHFDHVSAMAEVKRLTHARLAATGPEVALFESGGKADFRFGDDRTAWFEPVHVDQTLADGQKIGLGGTELTVHLSPGHTKGAASYEFMESDQGHDYRVLIANLPSINPGVTLIRNDKYPNIMADYAHTFATLKELHPDIFLASHAGQFGLHRKYQPGDTYQPMRFVDPAGYRAAVDGLEAAFQAQIAKERKQ
ncbi:MAG TPA: subclass B3 metallo-beta-lactamase [Bryobacteraceae bacterium]|jgi:metallo-beta-lactamase class B|nr:subclass B3 metallo-beta-lactamase [Bryobacteraceae bacterium]